MRDTIDMAREAGLWEERQSVGMAIGGVKDLERFEALVRADEREARAKLCDRHKLPDQPDSLRLKFVTEELEEYRAAFTPPAQPAPVQPAKQEQGEPVAWNRGVRSVYPQQKEGETFIVSYKDTQSKAKQEQGEPVIDKSAAIRIATALGWTPPEQERNFCSRCGKRLGKNDWDIHTCTLPRDNT